MTLSGDVFAPGGSTPATYANINTDAGRLSNGGTVLSYLKQYAGDTVMWDPWPAYDGVIRVLAPDNGAVTTISIQAALGSSGRAVADLSVEPLAHGGFVVAWSDYGDVSDATSWQVHYALYDNAGTLQSGGLLSSAHGHNVRIASLADGGFATVFAAASGGGGGPNQQGVVNVFSYDAGSGGYLHQPEAYVGDPNSNAPGASVGAEVGRLFLFDELSITALSSGGFVVGAPTYDLYVDNGQTHTPVGDFIFNYSSTGQQEAFASGAYWQRVNWNPGQINNAAVVTAYSGGFASLNRGDDGNWQVTLFHDDGSLVTSTAQTASVYHGGTYVSRTYYATDLGPVTMPALSTSTGGFTNLDDFVALVDAGSKLIAVLPNAAGGFDFASISKSTGALLGIADAGIEVPPGAVLANPRLLAEGSGFDFTYDVLTESGGYVLSSTYQVGLDAPPPNTAPVVGGIDGDAAVFVLGRPEYIDVDDFANVYDVDSASFDGGWLQVHQVSGSVDGSFGFDRGVGVTQILWGSGSAPDTSNDGIDFTAAAAPAVGDKVWYSGASSTDPATWELVGTIVADGQNGNDLRIAFTNTGASIPATPGDDNNYASLLLKYLMYTAPTLGARGFSVTISDGDGATSTPVGFTMSGTSDATSAITAAGGVAEPVVLPTSAASAAAAVAVFDFTVSDAGSGDALATRIKTLSLDAAGSGDFAQVTWLLSGPGIAAPLAGSYDGAAHKLVFDNAGISVADGASAVYTVKAYFADPAAAVTGSTYQLSLDGQAGVTLEQALSSQMAGVQTPVTNGSGSVVVTSPTVLAVEHAAPIGSAATNADTLSWTVRFSEAVQNLDAADFDVLGLSGETVTVADAGGNAWTVSVSGGGLAALDGSVTLALAAGQDIVNGDAQPLLDLNPSGIDGRSYLLDNTAPAAPGLPTLATDSGSVTTDGRTNVTTPTFTGSAEAGATVTLYDDNGAVLGTGVAAGGTWTIVSSLLAPGPHSVSARAVDTAGNESAASGALAVVIDTDATAPGLALAADTGRSASDGLTRDGRMTVTLDADVDGWEYSVDGGAHWNAGSGGGFTLGEAGYAIGQVQVRQRDTAGNLSPVQSNTGAITVDTSVAAPTFALVNDTGASAVDGITADGTVHIDLAGDVAGWEASVDGGVHWRAGGIDSFVLPAGRYEAGSVLVRQRDIAGNVSAAASNAQAVTVDAMAPGVAAVVRPALAGPSGSASFKVEVHYVDAGAGIDAASIDAADLTVSGAAGTLHVSGAAWDAVTGTATYTVDAPAGGWNPAAHAGSYAIGLATDAVRDLAGNALVPGAATAFQVSFNAAPHITSNGGGASAAIELPEQRTAVTTVAALDTDAGDTLAYSITGGQDAALFAIDAATGALSLRAAPSVASPQDSDGNNSYLVEVGASDGHGGLATQALTVTVLRDTDGDGLADIGDDDLDGDGRLNSTEDPVPSAHGGASGDGNGDGIADSQQVNVASLATVGSVAPALRYATIEVAPGLTLSAVGNSLASNLPRNAKMPLGQFDFTIDGLMAGASVDVALYVDKSLGANGYYKLVGSTWTNLATTSTVGNKTVISFKLTDGGIYDADGVANGRIVDPGGVAVIAPKIVSAGGDTSATVQVHENQATVMTVAAEAVGTVRYAITGGSDAALFTLDPVSGKLAFAAAPDFERPLDLGDNAADNTYLVEVTASDAAGSDTQRLKVEVLDVDEIARPDADGDQFPDLLEGTHGLTAGTRDNDVFASNKLFVMELYRDLMFREAAAPEWQYWQNILDAGKLGKTDLVSVFLDSSEFQGGAGAVARLYYSALERTPDRAGLVYWTQQLSGGEALRTVAGDIAGSAEFTAKYGALDSAGFVDQLYQNVLGRPADRAGLAYWDSALAAGTSRGEVLLGFAQSAEFKAASDHEVTTALGYLGLLGRDASAAEMAYWTGQLDAGQAEAKVVGRFLEVDEYHDRFLPHVVM